MSTDLYQRLGISPSATVEEVRTAYKQKALQTHPDKVPEALRESAAEEFREVSAAYEVLRDSENRRLYDLHGVWPPPDPAPHHEYQAGPENYNSRGHYRAHGGNRPFASPFFSQGFHDFAFMDPFALFESMFPEHSSRHARHADPFESMFRSPMDDFFNDFERQMFSGLGRRAHNHDVFSKPLQPTFGTPNIAKRGSGSRWASQTYSSQTVNGVTQTVETRCDWDGTEHVLRTHPDGRKSHTINGVEQVKGFLPQPRASGVPRPLPTSTTRSADQYLLSPAPLLLPPSPFSWPNQQFSNPPYGNHHWHRGGHHGHRSRTRSDVHHR